MQDATAQQQCHGLLWAKASQLFSAPAEVATARELFSAALQYAAPATRTKNARMLAACHAKLGQHQRAAEYLEIAARQEQQQQGAPSAITQLMRLQAAVHAHDAALALEGGWPGSPAHACVHISSCLTASHANGVAPALCCGMHRPSITQLPAACLCAAAIRGLPSCEGFHPSCLHTAQAVAAGAADPSVAKEAAAVAVKQLVSPDGCVGSLEPGEQSLVGVADQQWHRLACWHIPICAHKGAQLPVKSHCMVCCLLRRRGGAPAGGVHVSHTALHPGQARRRPC